MSVVSSAAMAATLVLTIVATSANTSFRLVPTSVKLGNILVPSYVVIDDDSLICAVNHSIVVLISPNSVSIPSIIAFKLDDIHAGIVVRVDPSYITTSDVLISNPN